jgi:hypothetical protein
MIATYARGPLGIHDNGIVTLTRHFCLLIIRWDRLYHAYTTHTLICLASCTEYNILVYILQCYIDQERFAKWRPMHRKSSWYMWAWLTTNQNVWLQESNWVRISQSLYEKFAWRATKIKVSKQLQNQSLAESVTHYSFVVQFTYTTTWAAIVLAVLINCEHAVDSQPL